MDMATEKKISRVEPNFFFLIVRQNNTILKQKSIMHHRIASVVYAEKEIKQLIT